MTHRTKIEDARFAATDESGVVLLITAVAVAVFVSFLALSIDTFRSTSAHTEKLIGSDTVALAALEEYLACISPTQGHAQCYPLAQARATRLAENNTVTAQNRRPHFMAGDAWDTGAGSAPPDPAGLIRVGRWWRDRPSGQCTTNTCPCLAGNPGDFPCLQVCDQQLGCALPDGSGVYTFGNAMYVGLRTRDNAPIENVFGKAFGQRTVQLQAAGIGATAPGSSLASVSPRHIVVLADLSRFTTMDNFLPAERDATPLVPPPAVSTARDHKEYAVPLTACGGQGAGPYAPYWAVAPTAAYTCHTPALAGGQAYAIASPAMGVPQPLTSILDASHVIIDYFQQQATQLDRLAFVGFDEDVLSSRVNLGDTNANLLVSKNHPIVQQLFDATAAVPATNRINGFFFPRGNVGSDIPNALDVARNMLRADPWFSGSDNMVILLTNGLSSCVRNTGGGRTCTYMSSTPYDTSFRVHMRSLEEMLNRNVYTDYLRDRIRLHTIMIGQEITPYDVLIREPVVGNRCMTDFEKRERGYLNSYWDTFANNALFYQNLGAFPTAPLGYAEPARYLYAASRALQGLWAPIRRSCDPTGTINWAQNFDIRCANETTPPMNAPPATLANPNSTMSYVIRDASYDDPPNPVSDSTGARIICEPDPAARTELLQIQRTMNTLLGNRPLLLVDR